MLDSANVGSHWDGGYYNKHSKPQKTCAHDLLKNYEFEGCEQVLDVGCGDGKITRDIAKLVPTGRVIGIDSSPSMIEFANSNVKQRALNLHFYTGHAERIAYKGIFDLAVSFSCLHWVQDQVGALQMIRKALRPGGTALLLTYPRCYYWDLLEETAQSKKWRKYFRDYQSPLSIFSREEYANLLEETGFSTFEIEVVETLDHYGSVEEYHNFVKGWLPHLTELPHCLRDEFLMEYSNEEFKHVGVDTSKPFSLPYIRMDVVAMA